MKHNECPDSQAANGVHWQASMILQQVKSRLIEMPEEIDKLKQTLSRRTDRSGIKERCAVILASLDGSYKTNIKTTFKITTIRQKMA